MKLEIHKTYQFDTEYNTLFPYNNHIRINFNKSVSNGMECVYIELDKQNARTLLNDLKMELGDDSLQS